MQTIVYDLRFLVVNKRRSREILVPVSVHPILGGHSRWREGGREGVREGVREGGRKKEEQSSSLALARASGQAALPS